MASNGNLPALKNITTEDNTNFNVHRMLLFCFTCSQMTHIYEQEKGKGAFDEEDANKKKILSRHGKAITRARVEGFIDAFLPVLLVQAKKKQ